MAQQNKSNYFKLVALITDIANIVIVEYIRENILGHTSFESFLNNQKHKLVHVYETFTCCKCSGGIISKKRLITRKQLLTLYKSDEGNIIKDHIKKDGKKIIQICICNYVAITNIDIRVVDITLANYIIQRCGKQEQGVDNWITQIKDVRNEIFHLSDMQEITDEKFNRNWTKLEGSILGIAKVIGPAYAEDTEKLILQTKKITIIAEYQLKHEKLCREYWKNKCAEFERAQLREIGEKAAFINYAMPDIVSRSMVEKCQRTLENIYNYTTMVDQIKILINIFGKEEITKKFLTTPLVKEDMQKQSIPVLLQLDIPNSWDQTKIFEAIDEMRLKGTPDMNIRIKAISADDLYVSAELANILSNASALNSEFDNFMVNLLQKAKVDRTQPAEMGLTLEVLDRKESSFRSSLPHEVNLRMKFRIKYEEGNSRCCIIINSQFVFTDYLNKRLLIYNTDGCFVRNIQLSGCSGSISVINDNQIAASFSQNYVEIISIDTGKPMNQIKTSGATSGISFQNGLLFVIINTERIDVFNLAGQAKRSFSSPSKHIHNISTNERRLFLCDSLDNTLYCCNLFGSVIWRFKDDNMKDIWGTTTDDNGNVYLSCQGSNIINVVSTDGKYRKELLTEKDEMLFPTGIYIDKSSNYLLICNYNSMYACVYDVLH